MGILIEEPLSHAEIVPCKGGKTGRRNMPHQGQHNAVLRIGRLCDTAKAKGHVFCHQLHEEPFI
jgi:hypothetical protein